MWRPIERTKVECLGGFTKRLGRVTAFEAEIWGVWEELKLARGKSFPKVELWIDSDIVVRVKQGINQGSAPPRLA